MSLLTVWTTPCDSGDLHFVTPLLSRVRCRVYRQRRLEQIWLPRLNDTKEHRRQELPALVRLALYVAPRNHLFGMRLSEPMLGGPVGMRQGSSGAHIGGRSRVSKETNCSQEGGRTVWVTADGPHRSFF